MPGRIPIQNLYYLFCYAWDQFPDGKAIEAGLTESPRVLDLFAQIIIRGLRRLQRRGLDRGYIEIDAVLETVRGRIDLNETIRRNLLVNGRVGCRFDELAPDVLHNQIIKATIAGLAKSADLDGALAEELRAIDRSLRHLSNVKLTAQCFRRVQVSRNRAQYRLLLNVCELLHHLQLPTEARGTTRFLDVLDDEVRMARVFESFVRNFYRHEQRRFSSVGSERIEWDLKPVGPESEKYLPYMMTDVTPRAPDKTIVLDTKYYRQTLTNYRGERVYSGHLYQLFSYLSNMELLSEVDRHADGILLYPVVGQHLDLKFSGRGHQIRVFTVNLAQGWPGIRAALLSLLDDQAAVASGESAMVI